MVLARKVSPAVVSMTHSKRPVGPKQMKSGTEINEDYINKWINTVWQVSCQRITNVNRGNLETNWRYNLP
jgi:hypothetical protein